MPVVRTTKTFRELRNQAEDNFAFHHPAVAGVYYGGSAQNFIGIRIECAKAGKEFFSNIAFGRDPEGELYYNNLSALAGVGKYEIQFRVGQVLQIVIRNPNDSIVACFVGADPASAIGWLTFDADDPEVPLVGHWNNYKALDVPSVITCAVGSTDVTISLGALAKKVTFKLPKPCVKGMNDMGTTTASSVDDIPNGTCSMVYFDADGVLYYPKIDSKVTTGYFTPSIKDKADLGQQAFINSSANGVFVLSRTSLAKAPTKPQLLGLWPVPGPSLSQYTAARWPGTSPESTAAVRRYLQRDYEEHHGFFNYTPGGAHNHTPFPLLVKWALNGTSKDLDAIWVQHEEIERYAYRSPAAITTDTAFEHLGDREYYQAYLHFFSDLVLKTPLSAVLEEWIFSPKVNLDGKQPQMLNRLLDGILHPMLYLGYGIEFSLPGLIAEGLAQVAVHGAPSPNLIPRSMFEAPTKRGPGTHAFSILSRIMSDRAFVNYSGSFGDLQMKLGQKIQSYAAEWLVDGANPQEIAKKVQELNFLNVIIYAVGGWRDGEGFHNAEFTLMHLVTSSMTLTSYLAVISSPTSKSLLLRAYFTRSVAYYIAQGRPELPIRSFFVAPVLTEFPGPGVNPTGFAFPNSTSPFADLWLKIIRSTLVHPDDHLCKVQRTLAHYDSLYGRIAAGEFKGTELKDCELVDGTLFVRTAALTMQWMGRIREGEAARFWGDDPNFPEARISP